VKAPYPGPVRHEPLAVELHNTLYAARGGLIDGLETPEDLGAWIDALAHRLPTPAGEVDAGRRPEFLALRGAVREALHAALGGRPVPAGALEALNEAAARAPVSPHAVEQPDGELRAVARYHAADATDVALAAIAADAIDLLSGPAREDLRACTAPSCVLMFSKDHPRRTWCSASCGNRARQARHYERSRRRRS
jgi:predicted RNA-binding Zn ribbon-like protein